MDLDDEPPMLVEAGEAFEAPEHLDSEMDHLNVTRVPITIITGTNLCFLLFSWVLDPSHPYHTCLSCRLQLTRKKKKDISEPAKQH